MLKATNNEWWYKRVTSFFISFLRCSFFLTLIFFHLTTERFNSLARHINHGIYFSLKRVFQLLFFVGCICELSRPFVHAWRRQFIIIVSLSLEAEASWDLEPLGPRESTTIIPKGAVALEEDRAPWKHYPAKMRRARVWRNILVIDRIRSCFAIRLLSYAKCFPIAWSESDKIMVGLPKSRCLLSSGIFGQKFTKNSHFWKNLCKRFFDPW